jgi:L,D-peptidoglycan transpeptidase YkuD (ErfK/YbiS/YcfS/YnhG family)
MKKYLLVFGLFLFQSLAAQLQTAQKLIVAVAENWNDSTGKMYLFDKSSAGWETFGTSWNVSFGRNGLAWGEGLHNNPDGELMKSEGDQRSPAGIFELGALYGLADTAPEGIRYPYQKITSRTRCVDDMQSKLYNMIIEEDSSAKDWSSDEEMGRIDPDYQFVLVVKHNPQNESGKGSCIFLHINNIPTSGCTAMDEENMLTLLRWLDPKKRTLVIQLPRAVYHSMRSVWKLPPLK